MRRCRRRLTAICDRRERSRPEGGASFAFGNMNLLARASRGSLHGCSRGFKRQRKPAEPNAEVDRGRHSSRGKEPRKRAAEKGGKGVGRSLSTDAGQKSRDPFRLRPPEAVIPGAETAVQTASSLAPSLVRGR